jgi:hypothetical protein
VTGNGLDIQGASLMAFNTAWDGGVFYTVQASGRPYANGANSKNYGDYCTAGCWGVGVPTNWRTEGFLPVSRSGATASTVAFGSIYGWGTKAPGAASVTHVGVAVGDYNAPNTSSFGTPENRWETNTY